MCGTDLPNLSKLRTFGCRVHVRPTTARYGKLVPNSRLGIFLGYSRSLKILYYYDLESAIVKTATHARFDEGMNDLADKPPPNVQILRQLNTDGSIMPDKLDVSPLDLSVSDDPFDRLDVLTPAITCDHPTLGFEISECHIRKRAYISNIAPLTSASRIKNSRRKYIGSFYRFRQRQSNIHRGLGHARFDGCRIVRRYIVPHRSCTRPIYPHCRPSP